MSSAGGGSILRSIQRPLFVRGVDSYRDGSSLRLSLFGGSLAQHCTLNKRDSTKGGHIFAKLPEYVIEKGGQSGKSVSDLVRR